MNDYVDYAALKSSALYSEFLSLTQQLRAVNLDSYSERQRKAFFISILFSTHCGAPSVIYYHPAAQPPPYSGICLP